MDISISIFFFCLGLVRKFNEDRISIILNILQPADRPLPIWPKSSFFSIYDGHAGPGITK